jgi:hypothetical protein
MIGSLEEMGEHRKVVIPNGRWLVVFIVHATSHTITPSMVHYRNLPPLPRVFAGYQLIKSVLGERNFGNCSIHVASADQTKVFNCIVGPTRTVAIQCPILVRSYDGVGRRNSMAAPHEPFFSGEDSEISSQTKECPNSDPDLTIIWNPNAAGSAVSEPMSSSPASLPERTGPIDFSVRLQKGTELRQT